VASIRGGERVRVDDPVITYRGELVGLGPLRKDVLPLMQQWWNDPEVMLPLSNHVFPSTAKDQEEWYEKWAVRGDGSTVHFLVYEVSTSRPIGVVNLSQINYRNQSAWASSYIGERECWGRGYGTEARRLLLAYAFSVCGLNNVTVAIHADNVRSLRVAEKLGYQEIGRQRQGVRRGHAYIDIVLLDILAADFEKAND
jgi:RimJ/RimL family protein N-acetyltransferase